MGTAFFDGFLLQASLIFALGSQNIFIIEQGMFGDRPFFISFICFFCDLILILIGVAGMGLILVDMPQVKIAFGILGILLMVFYGASRLKTNAFKVVANENRIKQTPSKLIFLCIIFSWLNPHAYLDAFVLIGGQATRYIDMVDKLIFGFGASAASLCWFLTISYVSKYFSSFLMRLMWFLNLSSVFLFLFLAYRMSFDVKQWVSELDQQTGQTISSQ